jgi:hypothetical protein
MYNPHKYNFLLNGQPGIVVSLTNERTEDKATNKCTYTGSLVTKVDTTLDPASTIKVLKNGATLAILENVSFLTDGTELKDSYDLSAGQAISYIAEKVTYPNS